MKRLQQFTILSAVIFLLASCDESKNDERFSQLSDDLALQIEALEKKVDTLEKEFMAEDSTDNELEDVELPTKKIHKSVGSSSAVQFNGSNKWGQLADLKTSINVDTKSSFVIAYTVSSWRNCNIQNSYVSTRLLIDGKEIRSFRQVGAGDYPSTSATDVIELSAGSHSISVQYMSPMSCSSNDNNPNYGSKFMGRNLTVHQL
jgi:outer membrane murein-binding lipoprotein Lpp